MSFALETQLPFLRPIFGRPSVSASLFGPRGSVRTSPDDALHQVDEADTHLPIGASEKIERIG